MFSEPLTDLIPEIRGLETDDHTATLQINIRNAVCLTAAHLIDLERYLEKNIPHACYIEVDAA